MPLGRALWLRVFSRAVAQSRFFSSHIPMCIAYAAASTAALFIGAFLLVPSAHPASSIWTVHRQQPGGTNSDHSAALDIIARGTITSPLSFDWNRAFNVPEGNPDPSGLHDQPAEPVLPAGQNLPMSPLFLAALETAAQCIAFYSVHLVARKKSRSSTFSEAPTEKRNLSQHQNDSPNVFSYLAPPIHALIAACSTYALATIAAGASAPLTPVLIVRTGGLVLAFVTACLLLSMKRPKQQSFTSGATLAGTAIFMAITGICGMPWLRNVNAKHVPALGMAALALVSVMGPWMLHEMSRGVESQDGAESQSRIATKAKQAFLASFLLFNAAHAYDDTRIVSHAIFTFPTLGFLAVSAFVTILSCLIYQNHETPPSKDGALITVATGFAAEMLRDTFLLLFVSWIPDISTTTLDWSPSSVKVLYAAATLCAICFLSKHTGIHAIGSIRPGRSKMSPTPTGILEGGATDNSGQPIFVDGLPTTEKEMHSYATYPGLTLRGFSVANRMVRISAVLSGLLVLLIGFEHISTAPTVPISTMGGAFDAPNPITLAPPSDHDIESSTRVDPQYNITLTLVVDRSLPAPIGAKNRTARPFLITATSKTLFSSLNDPADNSSLHWTAPIPPASTWPLRDYDLPPHPRSKDLHLKDLVFSAGGNPVSIQRSATACHTFGQLPDLDYRVVWVAEDDPEAMHGKRTFLMDSFKSVCGKYPVIMYGEPNRLDRTMHRKWFKQMSYLYTTAPNTTRWFIQGDDDTFWFPDVLLAHLRSLDVDPMVDSVYLGDICESVRQVRIGAVLAYGGGGMAISRALAARIAANYQYCIKVREQDFVGDIMMMQCIEDLTRVDGKGKSATLTRVPIFNQLDLMDWDWAKGAREYLSLHMSQVAPATLHHIEYMRPLVGGTPNKFRAMHDLWHLMMPIPPRLRFRRFMVNVVGAGTAVITFGYHVRIYDKRLPLGIEHHVDFDSNLSRDPEWLRIEVPLDDDKYAGTTEDQWPERRLDYRDFWIYEYDAERDTMVYLQEETQDKFALTCTTANGVKVGTLRTMCGTEKEVTEFEQDAEMLESFLEK